MTTPTGAPSVTVVIATRDRPQLLSRSVAAVLGQDYEAPIEVIIVYDQAAPDGSMGREEPGRRVLVTVNDRRPGLAGARNSGALSATGELLAFCDDDDEWLPGKLAAQVERLAQTGADVVVTGVLIDYDGRLNARVPSEADLTPMALATTRAMAAHPSSVLVRRTAFLDKIGLVDEDIPGSYGEDFDWMLRAAESGPIACVSEPLVRVLWGSQSYFSQRWRTIIEAIDYGLAKHPIFQETPRGLARLYGRRAFALAALGDGREARRWAWRSMRLSPRERRGYLAVVVSSGLVRPEWIIRVAQRRGHGV